MKRLILHIFNLLGLLPCILFAFACAKGPGPNDMIKLSQDEIWFDAKGGTYSITSNFEVLFDAIYTIDESGNRNLVSYKKQEDGKAIEFDWLKGLVLTSGESCELTFTAAPNEGTERKLSVSVGTPIAFKPITIHQAATK